MSMADDIRSRDSRSEQSHDVAPGNDGRPGGDPLAELARLIGQNDLFDQMRKDAARAELRATPTTPNEPDAAPDWFANARPSSPLRSAYEVSDERVARRRLAEPSYPQGNPLAPKHPADAPYVARPHEPYDAAAQYHDSRYDDAQGLYHTDTDVPPAQHAHDAQGGHQASHDGYEDPAEGYTDDAYDDEPQPKRKRGGLVTVAAVLGLAVIGTAGAFGYRALTGPSDVGQPPVIKADVAPTKIVPPPNEGAAKFIADRTDKPLGERVVSREEQPLDMPKTSGPKMVTTTGIPVPGGANPVVVASTATPTPAVGSEPKKVRTFPIRPDGTAMNDASAATRGGAPTPAPRTAAPAPVRTAALSPNAPTGSTNTAAPPAAATGGFVVQLVSNKSEAEAQSAFKGLQTKYPAVLGSRQALIRRVDLGDKGTYYRAQVGPFGSSEQANNLCGDLKAAGGQCIVQRN